MEGLNTLKKLSKIIFNERTAEEQFCFFVNTKAFMKLSDDFWYNVFHQEFWVNDINADTHGIAINQIMHCLHKGNFYAVLYECPKWAMSNKEITEMESWDYEDFIIKIDNSTQGSDGHVEVLKAISCRQFTWSDNDDSSTAPYIEIPAGSILPLEVGTNDVLKTWQYLCTDNHSAGLVRLCYDTNTPLQTPKPVICILYSTCKSDTF